MGYLPEDELSYQEAAAMKAAAKGVMQGEPEVKAYDGRTAVLRTHEKFVQDKDSPQNWIRKRRTSRFPPDFDCT